MSIIGSRLVRTYGEIRPYVVVLEHQGSGLVSEYFVGSVREGEALIREKSPPPPKIDRMMQWGSRG